MVVLSQDVRKQIESIREIVGNHSDSDIYNALKESHMNPSDAIDKLFYQDTFHEVRKRRDKKKENADHNVQVETGKHDDNIDQGPKFRSDRNGRRGGHTKRGTSREFRVVKDNRVNQSSPRGTKSSTQGVLSSTARRVYNASERGAYVASNNQRYSGSRSAQNFNAGNDFRPKVAREFKNNSRKEHVEENTSAATDSGLQASMTKQNESQLQSGSSTSSNAVGVYASASDPVHVPSPDSRSPAAIGAIRREIGVVGGRRQSSESAPKQSHQQSVSNLNPVVVSPATESVKHGSTVSRSGHNHGTGVVDSVMTNSAGNRFNSHLSNRFHQQPAGQKGPLPSKEWKPKTNQKPSVPSPGVIGSPVKSTSVQIDTPKNVERETDELQHTLSQIDIHEDENQKVIIAHDIRVPENSRCRVTFGSFGVESENIESSSSSFQVADVVEEADGVEPVEASPSNNQVNALDDQVRNSASSSLSGVSTENPLPNNNVAADVSNSDNYNEMSLVQNNSTFSTSKPEQPQESIELPNFSAYDPQPAYDMPYFRPSVDDAVRGTGLSSSQEVLSSHSGNSVPNTSVTMMQPQTPIAQMYPQVHFTNVMPYRQYLPQMYVPPMVPGYSNNPGYPHLSNGSSYVIMPGGNSHLPGNGLKYGVQQFKPFPAGSPTGFGGMASPTGYTMNAPGVVGGPAGLDESSRLKYKDNNLYVPNPQAETSEMWIPNHRDHPGMQSAAYFNMQGQATHPAYMQSHTGHPSFNAAAAQSSQMQFPGMYPPQPTGIPSGHHMGAGNIGVGVAPPAPGPQVGGYQQPQMNHLNWGTNF